MPQPLAEILIEDELASAEELGRASEAAEKQGVPLIVAVVRELGVEEVALVAAMRRRLRIAVTDPATAEVDPEALRELPRELCRRRRVVPLSVAIYDSGSRILRLAMADPTDKVAVAEVEHSTGCRVEATLMPLSAVEELVETAYRHFVTEVMKRPGGGAARKRPSAARRVTDDADLKLRLEALVSLLVDSGVLAEGEYEARLRTLLERERS